VTETCQVDFYVLADPVRSAESLACQLALMAWEQGHRVCVRTEDELEAQRIDELMWDQPPGRFLPHEIGAGAEECPVRIETGGEDVPGDRDVVINLATSAVPEPARFSRLLEVVPQEGDRRQASRGKYRAYRDQGLDPAHHTIGKP
jgi:DNA polymerase-3 subunit chi